MAMDAFRRLAWALAIETYALIFIGAATKAYGAGLACPDWPLCFGKLIPQMNFLVFLEWGHRLGAFLIVILAGWALVAALRIPGDRRPWVRWAAASVGLVLLQSLFGGFTVIFRLAPWVEAGHTALATAFLTLWVLAAISAGMRGPVGAGGRPAGGTPVWGVPLAAALATYVTIILGSYMKAAHGGLACADWPLCNGQVIPSLDHPLVLLQFIHRMAALAAFSLIVYTAYFVFRRAGHVPALAIPAGAALGLVFLQVLIGGLAVVWRLPPPVTIAHMAVAAALVATLAALALVAYLHSPARPARAGLAVTPPAPQARA